MNIKNLIIALFVVFVLVSDTKADTINLSEAITKKYVTIMVQRNTTENNTRTVSPSYTGKCISLKIMNISGKKLLIHVEAGRFMMPDDTSEQRMIITQEELITLQKQQNVTKELFAMCSEMHDRSPGPQATFKIGEMASGNLLALAKFISGNKYQTMAAQSAIWAITDNNDPSDIYSENAIEMKALKDFVYKATGKKETTKKQFLKYEKGKVSGSLEFELKQDKIMTMILYDDKGKEIRRGFKDYKFKAGTNTLSYQYEYYNIPAGNYYIKLVDSAGNIFLSKMLSFKYD